MMDVDGDEGAAPRSRHGRGVVLFLLVGVLNTLTFTVVFVVLREAGLGAPPATVVGYGAGVAQSVWLHRRWVFAAEAARSRRQLASHVAVLVVVGVVATVAAVPIGDAEGLGSIEEAVLLVLVQGGFVVIRYVLLRFGVYT